MKLHTVPGSPNSRKVEAVIAHLGLEVKIRHYDLFNGELRRPDYLMLNPNAMAPTLEDGDFVLWESSAIMQYLADKAGDESLLPREARLRAEVTRWQIWGTVHFNQAFGTLAFETVAKQKFGIGPGDPVLIRQAQDQMARFAPVLDARVAGRACLVGNDITLADYSTIVFESYRPLVPVDWTPYHHLNQYFDRLKQAPAWQKVISAETPPVSRVA
jgi:glutathione S-transferase